MIIPLLKKHFGLIMFVLITAAAAVTWYVNQLTPELSEAQKQRADQMLEAEAFVKSHVWNFNRLSVGVIKSEVEPAAYAVELCKKAAAVGAKPESVQVVDVLKLQKSGGEEWQEIGFANCR